MAKRLTSTDRTTDAGTSSGACKRGVPTLTKRDLVLRIAEQSKLPQDFVHKLVQQILDQIIEALVAGNHIEFRDFGVFEITRRRARIGRNPNRPEHTVVIPDRQVVKFKPGKRMKQLIGRK